MKKAANRKRPAVNKVYYIYVGILAEICGVWLSRKNYEVNGDNITAISFALFLSLIFTSLTPSP